MVQAAASSDMEEKKMNALSPLVSAHEAVERHRHLQQCRRYGRERPDAN
jgi:hypothetical protein